MQLGLARTIVLVSSASLLQCIIVPWRTPALQTSAWVWYRSPSHGWPPWPHQPLNPSSSSPPWPQLTTVPPPWTLRPQLPPAHQGFLNTPPYPWLDPWTEEPWYRQCDCGQPVIPLSSTRRPREVNDLENEVDGINPDRVEEDSHTDRIVGGLQAAPHQYPWLVLLVLQPDPVAPSVLWCGGAVISEFYVLTAAHCVKGVPVSDLKVLVGVHDRCVSEQTSAALSVASAEFPAEFEPKLLANDIALLRLSMRLTFSETLRPICMPRPGAVYWGHEGEVAGWGKVGYGNASGSCLLLRAKLPVLSRAACAESSYRVNQITRTHFCAGDIERGGVDTCQGDSGGPLMVPRVQDSRYELVGVVSGGQGCALPGYPGLYTRVTDFLPWLEKRTRDAPFCVRPSVIS